MHNGHQTCNFAFMQAQLFELQEMFCQLSRSVNVNKNRVEPYTKDLAFQLLEFLIHKPTPSPLKLFSIHTSHPTTHSI